MKCITGGTGSGKSFFLIWYLLSVILKGERWVTAVFPHRPAALRLIAELYWMFGEALLEFLLIEDLDQAKKVVMRNAIPAASADLDHWDRKLLNNEFLWAEQERLTLRRKDIKDIAEKPNLEQYSALAIRVAQNQDAWFPGADAPKMLRPLTRWWRYFRNHCTEDEAREELMRLEDLAVREWPMTVLPTERLMSNVHGNVLLAARTSRPPKLHLGAFLNGGHSGLRPGVKLYIGGAGSPDALRTLVGCDVHETAALALGNKLGPGLYCIDEFGNYRFGSEWWAQKAATLRFTGMELLAVQHAFDWETDHGRKWNQQCDHYLFNQTDPDNADFAAKIVRGSYDRMAVHHEEEIVRATFETSYEEQVTVSEGPHGKTVARRNVPVTRHGQQIDTKPVYEPGQDQQFWQASEFQELPARVCWVKQQGRRPYRFDVPDVPDSSVIDGESAAEEVADRCIQQLMDRLSIYETPAIVTVPDEPDPPPPPKPKKPKRKKPSAETAKNLGKPREKKSANGSPAGHAGRNTSSTSTARGRRSTK